MFFFLQKFWRLTSCFKLTLISGQYIQLWHSLALMYGLLLLSPDKNQPNGLFQGAKSLIKTVSSLYLKPPALSQLYHGRVLFPLLNQLFQCLQLHMALLHTLEWSKWSLQQILRTFSPIQWEWEGSPRWYRSSYLEIFWHILTFHILSLPIDFFYWLQRKIAWTPDSNDSLNSGMIRITLAGCAWFSDRLQSQRCSFTGRFFGGMARVQLFIGICVQTIYATNVN